METWSKSNLKTEPLIFILSFSMKKQHKAGELAQHYKYLSGKREVVSSILGTNKKKNEKKEKRKPHNGNKHAKVSEANWRMSWGPQQRVDIRLPPSQSFSAMRIQVHFHKPKTTLHHQCCLNPAMVSILSILVTFHCLPTTINRTPDKWRLLYFRIEN